MRERVRGGKGRGELYPTLQWDVKEENYQFYAIILL